jgi:hypothetical protein
VLEINQKISSTPTVIVPLDESESSVPNTGQWAPPGFYHPIAGLPSWDTQSLASTFSTTMLQQPLTNEWYFDSGATSYMTSSSSSLSHFFPAVSYSFIHCCQ